MAKTLLIYVLCALTAGCASHDEVARSRSPDGALDAVLVESNGGVLTSFWYDVYVTNAGSHYWFQKSAVYLYGAQRSGHAYGANLRWKGADELVVEFLDAEQAKVEMPTVKVGMRSVDVVLASGVTDLAAKPGGMLYNLQGRPYDAPDKSSQPTVQPLP